MTDSDSGEFVLREAGLSDIPQVVDVWTEFMQFHADLNPTFTRGPEAEEAFAKHLEDRINSEKSLLLVAQQHETIVGYCLAGMAERPPVFVDREYGMIDDLAVVGDKRRQGIGEALLKATEDWFRMRGTCRVELQLVTANEVASGFWTKMGYERYMERRFKTV